MSDVITVRIDKETKKGIKKYGINVSKVVRSALKAEIRRRERQSLAESLGTVKRVLDMSERVNDR